MGSNPEQPIAIMKSDNIMITLVFSLLFIIVIVFFAGSKISTLEEKVSALEDVVFVHGLYKDLESENSN